MELNVILMFVFLGIILLGIIFAVVIGLLFAIKKRTIVHIIHPNNYITRHKFTGAMKKKFSIGNMSYVYDGNNEFRKGFRHYIYYYYNKTYPIKLNHKSLEFDADEYNATELNALLKTNLVEKLLDITRGFDLLKIVLLVVALLVVGNIVLTIVLHNGGSIATTENADFIKEVVRNAISN